MDDAAPIIPSDGANPEPVTRGRFFAHGTRCPRCAYALDGCVPGECPECGAVTIDLAHDGRVRQATDLELARAADARLRTSWRAVLGLALRGTNSATGAIFLVALLAVVVAPLLLAVDRRPDPWRMITGAIAKGAGLLTALLAVQLGLSWRKVANHQRQRAQGLAADLADRRVAEYELEITHAMRVSAPDGPWLVLRLRGGGVLRLTAQGQRLLGWPSGALLGRDARLVLLPRSFVPVGLTLAGDPVPTVPRTDLRARRWHAYAGDPVAAGSRVEELVKPSRSAAPPFAPTGETHPPPTAG